MLIRLYLDEDAMDRDLAEGLRQRGVDLLTALDAGMIARSDTEHLEFAALENRALYSFNVSDFAPYTPNSPPNSRTTQESF